MTRFVGIALLGLAVGCGGAQEPAPARRDAIASSLPPPRAGADLLGRSLARLDLLRWIGEEVPLSGAEAAPATLLRWWTDTCPHCEGTLPAVERLRSEYGAAGLATVAVYHPKPPRPVDDDEVAAAALALGYAGPVAVDVDWSALERAWPRELGRTATSVSLLVDRDGVVRFVHPGPRFFPSEDPELELSQRDWEDVRAAVEALLAGAGG